MKWFWVLEIFKSLQNLQMHKEQKILHVYALCICGQILNLAQDLSFIDMTMEGLHFAVRLLMLLTLTFPIEIWAKSICQLFD